MKRLVLFLILTAIILFFASDCFCQNFKYDSKGRRDPFTPLVTNDGRFTSTIMEDNIGIEEINLEGIILDTKEGNMAIINDTVVKAGERIGSFEVIDIMNEKVILQRGNREFIINLVPELEEMNDVKEIKSFRPISR